MSPDKPSSLTLLSWNVNGIRAAERKGFLPWLAKSKADMIGIQETKVSDPNMLSEELRHPNGFQTFWNCSTTKKGYSGVAIYSKLQPKTVQTEFGASLLSDEGRMIECDYGSFLLINLYIPNGGMGETRLNYKLKFYLQLLDYLTALKKRGKKIVFCGDINTAHHEIDLAHPKENVHRSGFMSIEREWLDKFEAAGFIDTFRLFHPGEGGHYTWWDQRTGARARDIGWRIDYFYVTPNLKTRVKEAFILKQVQGSDHCPIGIQLTL